MARQALQFLDSKRRESSTSVDEGGLQLSSAEKKKRKIIQYHHSAAQEGADTAFTALSNLNMCAFFILFLCAYFYSRKEILRNLL